MKFCGKCGNKITPQIQKFCKDCGAKLMDGAMFCNVCGGKTDNAMDISAESDHVQGVNTETTNLSDYAVYTTKNGKHQKLGSLQPHSKKVTDEGNNIVFTYENGRLHSTKTGSYYTVDFKGDIYENDQKVGYIQNYLEYTNKHENSYESPNLNSSTHNTSNNNYSPTPKPSQNGMSKNMMITIIVAAASVVTIILFGALFAGIVASRAKKNNSEFTNGNYPLSNNVTTATQELITVIDVINMEYPDAVKALSDAGFTNITSDVQSSADDERWVVVTQSVPAGKEILAEDNIALSCVKRCYLYLDITSENNLVFSKYSITLSLDGTTIGTVDNGGVITYLADVDCGEHILSFCKSDASVPNQSKSLTVQKDTTYSCKLSHGSGYIEIKNEDIQFNIDKASLEVIDVIDIPLSDAKAKLKSIGFTNIVTDPASITGESSWIVTTQSIAPGLCIDKNESIQLGCVNGDDYFAYYIGKNPNECDKMAAGSWYKITYKKDAFTTYDLSLLSERGKEDYIVSSVSYLGGSKDLNLYLDYIGPTPVPTATSTPRPTNNTTRTTTEATSKSVDYSTNDYETAKDGNTGVYAYIRSGPNYDIYLIIDFDEGFVYYFTEGNGDETCEKMEIDSGDLNSLLYFYYVDGDDVALYAVNFAWARRPEHLILQDEDGFDWDYYSTNLNRALALRDSKEIYDYY